MKTLIMGPAIVLSLIAVSAVAITGKLYAIETPASVLAVMQKQDKGTGAAIKQDKEKIAQEREAIIAAGRRLQEAKRTGDKMVIERVKKEVEQDIKTRKATISALKDDIYQKSNVRIDMGAGAHRKDK